MCWCVGWLGCGRVGMLVWLFVGVLVGVFVCVLVCLRVWYVGVFNCVGRLCVCVLLS